MKPLRLAIAAALALALTGCLEVEQHPAWVNGKYAGKPDNRVAQVSFHNDKLEWKAAILNRNLQQNEYNRANP